MLIACKSCHRQFDVAGMRAEERIRCRCGELLVVPENRPREARLLHCQGCGASLRSGDARCAYCGSEISATDRDLGPACPECFARLRKDARFCNDCGIAIKPEALKTTRATAKCPRCKGSLVLRELPQAHYTECTSCAGIWLDATSFERAVEERDTSALGTLFPVTKDAASKGGVEPVKYLPCPVCGRMMNRRNFGGCSGVIIDSCKGHGFWFDTFELEKVLAFVRSGGLDRAREREIASAKAEIASLQEQKRAVASAMPFDAEVPRTNWENVLGSAFSVLSKLF